MKYLLVILSIVLVGCSAPNVKPKNIVVDLRDSQFLNPMYRCTDTLGDSFRDNKCPESCYGDAGEPERGDWSFDVKLKFYDPQETQGKQNTVEEVKALYAKGGVRNLSIYEDEKDLDKFCFVETDVDDKGNKISGLIDFGGYLTGLPKNIVKSRFKRFDTSQCKYLEKAYFPTKDYNWDFTTTKNFKHWKKYGINEEELEWFESMKHHKSRETTLELRKRALLDKLGRYGKTIGATHYFREANGLISCK